MKKILCAHCPQAHKPQRAHTQGVKDTAECDASTPPPPKTLAAAHCPPAARAGDGQRGDAAVLGENKKMSGWRI